MAKLTHNRNTNKGIFIKAIFFLSFCLLSVHAWSQAFHAVQVNANLIPPYSLYLDDYTTGTRDRIMVTLVNKDVQYPSMHVRLKLTIKANGFTLRTNDYAVITPIVLEPNIPYRLSREEIAEYFNPKNLTASGMGTSAWQKDRKLPEGMIEFSFEVFEHFSGNKLSLPGNALAWVSVQKPPQLSLPFNEETVSYRDPLNLLFQWTPRHTGIANVEYVFILKQLWDNGMKPEAAWAYSTELVRETVKPTSFLYGAAMFPLTPGMRYAWAVQAIAKDGFDDIRVFENNGLSEIRSFSVADHCPPPLSITAKIDRGKIAIEWIPLPEHIDFTVSYRKTGLAEDGLVWDWFYTKTKQSKVVLHDVRPGFTYEYRIGTSCKPNTPIYGDTYTIFLPIEDYPINCGVASEVDLSNTEPLLSLSPGEMFMAFDFPTYVINVTGGNGVFTGDGYTIMPSMFNHAKLRVKWSNITINTDYRMIKGFVEGVYDESKSQVVDLDDIFEGGARFGKVEQGITKADIDLSFTVSENSKITFNPDNGTITIDGNTVDVSQIIAQRELTGDGGSIFPITVKDANGNIYQIDEADSDSGELTLTPVGKQGAPIAPGAVDFKNIASNKAIVTFEKAGKYAFDTWIDQYTGKQLIRDKYETLSDNYKVPFKLIPQGKTDIVKAQIQIIDKAVNPESVVFKTPAGTEFSYKYENNTYTITIAGGESGDGLEIYALYPGGKGYFNLGKLVVLSYPERTYNLVAVDINNAGVDVSALNNKLNEIYNPLGITWNVTDDSYTYTGNTQFMESGSGLLSAYPDAMKAFQNEYSVNRSIDDKTAYLFFFNQFGAGSSKNRDADGFMPRNKQFGYLFTQGFGSDNELYTAAAHELGHGMFVLKHTFDNDYKIPQGETNNLMDYAANATHVAKWQWDLIHDPGVVVRVFEGDEDGAGIFKSDLSGIFYQDSLLSNNQTLYFLPAIEEKVILWAKNKNEKEYKIKWEMEGQLYNSDSISFIVNETLFGDKEIVKIRAIDKVLLGKDSAIVINIEKINIDFDFLVDSLTAHIIHAKQRFDSLQQILPNHIEKNMDKLSLLEVKYISRGMSNELDISADSQDKQIERILSEMYYLDKLMLEIKNFDEYYKNIKEKYNTLEQKKKFIEQVKQSITLISPLEIKETIKSQYKVAIIQSIYDLLIITEEQNEN